MRADTGQWDIRVPVRLLERFPREARQGYWFKVDRATAREVCEMLAEVYQVPAPQVDETNPKGNNGWYRSWINGGTISIWSRAHLKTVFHEFYHHLDFATAGGYNSDDFPGRRSRLARTGEPTPPTSLAWIFAEKLWDKMKELTYEGYDVREVG